MVLSKRTIPHYTYVDECDATTLVQLRESLKESFARKKTKITYLAFVVKAVTLALKEVPIVNATLNDEAGEIILSDQYHIGIAVATPGGLIVPVVRDADKKSLLEVAREIERLSNDARIGKSRLRGSARRHLHHHVDRQPRRPLRHAHYPSPASGDPRRGQNRQASHLRR